jgi:hypothetical protein
MREVRSASRPGHFFLGTQWTGSFAGFRSCLMLQKLQESKEKLFP